MRFFSSRGAQSHRKTHHQAIIFSPLLMLIYSRFITQLRSHKSTNLCQNTKTSFFTFLLQDCVGAIRAAQHQGLLFLSSKSLKLEGKRHLPATWPTTDLSCSHATGGRPLLPRTHGQSELWTIITCMVFFMCCHRTVSCF